MNEKVLQQLETDIKLRGLSVNTMADYVKRTGFFLQWADKPAAGWIMLLSNIY